MVDGRRYSSTEWILWWAQYNAEEFTDRWLRACNIEVADGRPPMLP